MNPLFSSMNNPINTLLGMLKQQNPQGFQMYLRLKESGRDPNEIVNEMMSQLTPQQKELIKVMGNKFK